MCLSMSIAYSSAGKGSHSRRSGDVHGATRTPECTTIALAVVSLVLRWRSVQSTVRLLALGWLALPGEKSDQNQIFFVGSRR